VLRANFHLGPAVAQHFVRVPHGFAVQIIRILRQQIDDVPKLVQERDHLRGQRVPWIRSNGQQTRAIRAYGTASLDYF
jgi:hypothetical protein